MLSRQLVAQECFRPPDPGAHTAMMVEDDIEPILSQIVSSGIQSKACGDVLQCGSRDVAMQHRPCMLGRLEFVVPAVSGEGSMG